MKRMESVPAVTLATSAGMPKLPDLSRLSNRVNQVLAESGDGQFGGQQTGKVSHDKCCRLNIDEGISSRLNIKRQQIYPIPIFQSSRQVDRA